MHRFRSWKGGMAHSKIISRMPQSLETHLDNNAYPQQSEITHHIKACVIHARGSQQSSAEQTQWYWSCHNNLCNRCGGWGIIINLSPSSTGYTELIVTCILNSKILKIHPPRIPYIYVRNFLKLTWAGKLTSILQNGVHELTQSTYTVSYSYQDSTSHGPVNFAAIIILHAHTECSNLLSQIWIKSSSSIRVCRNSRSEWIFKSRKPFTQDWIFINYRDLH